MSVIENIKDYVSSGLGARNIYFLDRDHAPSKGKPNYDLIHGGWVSNFEVKKGSDIVSYIPMNTPKTYVILDKKPNNKRYVYKTVSDDGQELFYASDKLMLDFVRDVLQDHLKSTAVVLEFPAATMVFYGVLNFTFIEKKGRSEAHVKSDIDAVFQGVEYKTISYDEFIKIVENRAIPLPFVVVGGVLLLLILGYVMMSEEEAPLPPPSPHTPIEKHKKALEEKAKTLSRDEHALAISQYALRSLLTIRSTPGSFVGDVIFNTNQPKANIYFLYPDLNTKKKKEFYVREISLTPDKMNRKKAFGFGMIVKDEIKPVRECINEIRRFADVQKIDEKGIKFSYKKDEDIQTLWHNLKAIYGCPVALKGMIRFKDMKTRSVNLNINLYLKM